MNERQEMLADIVAEKRACADEIEAFIRHLAAISAALFVAGCDEPPGVERHINTVDYVVRTVEVKGHEYIVFDGCYKGNIIHSESCPCKARKEGAAK